MATTSAAQPELHPLADERPSLAGLLRRALDPGRAVYRPLLIGAAGCLGLLAALFWPNLAHFAYTWSTDENYSHGFLVPLLSLYFANEAARRGPLPVRGGIAPGVALLVVAVLGRVATILVPIGIVGDLALLLGLAGLVALFAGSAALRRYGFALAFLVFMVPLPIALYTAIASPLQRLVSLASSSLLNAAGIPVLCHGNVMTLPGGIQMFVAEACSGMRQLTGFLALATAVAYLSSRPAWYRVVVVASAVPIAMTANIIRVMATGAIMYHVDPKFALGSFHTAEGLLMMGLGLALLASVCTLLGWVAPTSRSGHAGQPALEPRAVTPGALKAAPRVALGCAVLGIGLAAQGATERLVETPRPPLKQPLATLPLQLGPWLGRDVPVDPRVVEESQATEYLNRVYEDPRRPGLQLTLWINYSEFGLNMRHSPEVCLPSGGWEKVESQTRVLEVFGPEGPVLLTRLTYRQGELVQGIGFWYYIFGEGWLERSVRQLPITSRSSHGRTTRGSGLTVEVFCPGEADPDGAALREFAGALLAELDPLLPDDRAIYHIP